MSAFMRDLLAAVLIVAGMALGASGMVSTVLDPRGVSPFLLAFVALFLWLSSAWIAWLGMRLGRAVAS